MATDGPRRLNRSQLTVIIALALIAGLLIGGALGLGKALFGGPNPETVASSALQSMRAQNRLVPFVARYVSVVSSTQSQLAGLIRTERTLILPGDVRYELDLSRLGPEDVKWDGSENTLTVILPEIEIAGPEVDLAAAREYGAGGFSELLTSGANALDQANRARAVAELRKQAMAEVPMRLAREAGRQAVERSFALPLLAAGFEGAKVVARYPTEGDGSAEYLDRSRSYNEVLDEARTRR